MVVWSQVTHGCYYGLQWVLLDPSHFAHFITPARLISGKWKPYNMTTQMVCATHIYMYSCLVGLSLDCHSICTAVQWGSHQIAPVYVQLFSVALTRLPLYMYSCLVGLSLDCHCICTAVQWGSHQIATVYVQLFSGALTRLTLYVYSCLVGLSLDCHCMCTAVQQGSHQIATVHTYNCLAGLSLVYQLYNVYNIKHSYHAYNTPTKLQTDSGAIIKIILVM